jgi:hypothetical protein
MKSKTRLLLVRVRHAQRLLLRANIAMTLTQFVFWAAVTGIAAAVVLRARRHGPSHSSNEPALAQPGGPP